MSDEVRGDNPVESGRTTGAARRGSSSGSGVALKLYKPGQGYYTRLGTAIGIGVLAVSGAFFVHDQMSNIVTDSSRALYIQYGVSVAWLALFGMLGYWIAGLNRRVNDFFIATEGEMKKVRWSTRKEIVRSTKVVIVSVILLGAFLYVCNMFFMGLFTIIGVLEMAEKVVE